MATITKRMINAALAKAGLDMVIEGNRYDGYYYFLDLEDNQVGSSIPVCYLHHQSVDGWVADAKACKEEQDRIDRGEW